MRNKTKNLLSTLIKKLRILSKIFYLADKIHDLLTRTGFFNIKTIFIFYLYVLFNIYSQLLLFIFCTQKC